MLGESVGLQVWHECYRLNRLSLELFVAENCGSFLPILLQLDVCEQCMYVYDVQSK